MPNTDVIGQTLLRGRLQEIIALLDSLATTNYKPEGITVDSEKDFSIVLADGPLLLVSFEMSAGDIIRNLQTALEADGVKVKFTTLHYIDLRFGNRVYYK